MQAREELKNPAISGGHLVRAGLALAEWSERWFPDPLVFAFIGVILVFCAGVATGESPSNLAIQAGKSFWSLIPFTLQMVMVIIGGYVIASTPLVRAAIRKLVQIPKTPRAAVALVAFFSMFTSLISWGLSLIFSGMLAREMAREVKGLDYRANATAAYLGVGTVWAMGLSSSAAMLVATRSAMPPGLFEISGLIPLTQTIFLWQSLVTTTLLIAVSVATAYLSAPSGKNAKTFEQFGIVLEPLGAQEETRTTPGEWLEFSPILTILMVLLLGTYLVSVFRSSERGPLAALDLNTYNLMFLTGGLLLHWRPRRFLRAVTDCIPATGGVIIQFPIYAMIFGMITNTDLSHKMSRLLASASTHDTYALIVGAYSAMLGLFVPSGGSKWIIEAPYVLQAAITNHVHMGWVVQIYNASEALPNLVNPFYMLPLLGILKLRARDLAGYGVLQFAVQTPLVFFLCWFFAKNMAFIPPMK